MGYRLIADVTVFQGFAVVERGENGFSRTYGVRARKLHIPPPANVEEHVETFANLEKVHEMTPRLQF